MCVCVCTHPCTHLQAYKYICMHTGYIHMHIQAYARHMSAPIHIHTRTHIQSTHTDYTHTDTQQKQTHTCNRGEGKSTDTISYVYHIHVHTRSYVSYSCTLYHMCIIFMYTIPATGAKTKELAIYYIVQKRLQQYLQPGRRPKNWRDPYPPLR